MVSRYRRRQMVTENNTTKAPKMSLDKNNFIYFSKQHRKRKKKIASGVATNGNIFLWVDKDKYT